MKEVLVSVKKFLEERGWTDLKPSNLAKSICIEAAELLEIFQWDNEDLAATKTDAKRMKKIREELADVIIYALDMAALLDIDAEQAIREKITHNSKKYPAKLMKKVRSAKPGTESEYLKIKKAYREKGG